MSGWTTKKLAENGFEMERLKELQKLMDSEDCDLLDALLQLIVTKYHTLPDASRILGDLKLISTGFATLQRAVYAA